ncbi:MAG: hypothetical protein A2W11_08030 [Ignavibacteria bacterium RBG_16_35_7]|nr:MAG: hypothetical protein A2W11_08030 [Ignavibacteria bacterium RBG_16_35_7]
MFIIRQIKLCLDEPNLIIPQINSELVKSFPSAKHVIIKNAGHNVHFEKPEEFVKVMSAFTETD